MIGDVVFRREALSEGLEEAKPLLARHWRELALNQDRFPLDPDYFAYLKRERAGGVRAYSVRTPGGALVGYAIYFVQRHLHYRTVKYAISDVFWLSPTLRTRRSRFVRMLRRIRYWLLPGAIQQTIGARFFSFIESELKREGVHVMHTTYKVEHPAAGRVLSLLGHRRIEAGHSKVLN